MKMKRLIPLAVLAAISCGGEDAAPGEQDVNEAPVTLLGNTEIIPTYTVIADARDGLDVPRDLGFHPERIGELWIVNRADDSVVIVSDATQNHSDIFKLIDGYALHFMEEVSSIAFGAKTFQDDYTFGTCQETENTYNGQSPPDFFMGPSLWSADLSVFAVENPIGLGSHLDMLHHSPNCMGIAHERENVYWVFDGHHGQIVRYDFQEDHGAGYDDHSDGIITFLETPKVSRVPDVPSHLVLDHARDTLYVADTGKARILAVDTVAREYVRRIPPIERGTVVEEWDAPWTELIPASSGLLEAPSGIALHDDILYVGDNATGDILAFDLGGETPGELLARLPTGVEPGDLMGLEVGPDERLYIVDASGLVMRLEK